LVGRLAEYASSSEFAVGTATVVEKAYEASHTSTGTGMVSTGKTVVPVTTTHHSSEKYVLIVQIGDDVFSASADAKTWAQVSKGDSVHITETRGRIFGVSFGRSASLRSK
jgi:hypothetical protein